MNIGERFAWLHDVIAADPRPTLGETAVAVALAEHFNAQREMAWPAQRTMAAMLRMDRRTIRRALVALEARGFIKQLREGGPRISAGFTLAHPEGALQRPQRAPYSARSGRSTAPSEGAPQRPEQVGTRNDDVGFRNCAANARSGSAGATPQRARGARTTEGRRAPSAPTTL